MGNVIRENVARGNGVRGNVIRGNIIRGNVVRGNVVREPSLEESAPYRFSQFQSKRLFLSQIRCRHPQSAELEFGRQLLGTALYTAECKGTRKERFLEKKTSSSALKSTEAQ
jgi:hypothetical protein